MALAALLLAACGGSGSTGLIVPEAGILTDVRTRGVCIDANATTYCPAGGAEVNTDAPGLSPSLPCPTGGSCEGGTIRFRFDVVDLDPEWTCAVAAREAGLDWTLGELRSVTSPDAGAAFVVAVPPGFDPATDDVQAALLCFDAPPTLPPTVATLADTAPTIVFVAFL
jgi:hypothetical protein